MTIFRPHTPSSKRSDRSARDRSRHRHKVKDSIRKNIADIIAEESIIGSDGSQVIKVPIRSIKEHRFIYGQNSPGAASGTGESKEGDVVQKGKGKPGEGEGKGGNQPGKDAIETEITIEELIEIMFEDLELPDLVQKSFKQVVSESAVKRKGMRKKGIRPRLNKIESAKNRIRRKIAVNKRIRETDEEQEDERFPFHEDDLRYFYVTPREKESSNAVIFCIMDTSGSMGTVKKYLARSFYFLLYQFIRQKYNNVEVVYIAHHTEAKEVSENDFFHKVESGGTYISSGYQKALEIIDKRYHPENWNIYAFHCSDGDNFYSDNDQAVAAAEKLCSVANLFGYGEIKPSGGAYYSGTMMEIFSKVKNKNFFPLTISGKEDLWSAFKSFLNKDRKPEAAQASEPDKAKADASKSGATP